MQQASPASNEVRLPRAVVEGNDPAAGTPPAAGPGVTAAPPVEPQPPKPSVATTDPRHSDPLYWKQRFDVVTGFLTQERQQHATVVEQLSQQIDELEGQVATLKATPPSSSKIDPGKYFTPEQIERMGEEEATSIAATAEKAAQEAANAAVERMTAMLKPVENQREREAKANTERRKREYKEALLAEYPDFDEMDHADDWIAYLQANYGTTDIPRQQILNRYIVTFNVPKTIEFIKEFLETRNRPAPPVVPQSEGAKPGDGELPEPPVPGATDYPSRQEIRDFYKRSSLRQVTDAERTKFEARLSRRAA